MSRLIGEDRTASTSHQPNRKAYGPMFQPIMYYRPDDMFVRVLLLSPWVAYGRTALVEHPQRGRCTVRCSELSV